MRLLVCWLNLCRIQLYINCTLECVINSHKTIQQPLRMTDEDWGIYKSTVNSSLLVSLLHWLTAKMTVFVKIAHCDHYYATTYYSSVNMYKNEIMVCVTMILFFFFSRNILSLIFKQQTNKVIFVLTYLICHNLCHGSTCALSVWPDNICLKIVCIFMFVYLFFCAICILYVLLLCLNYMYYYYVF